MKTYKAQISYIMESNDKKINNVHSNDCDSLASVIVGNISKVFKRDPSCKVMSIKYYEIDGTKQTRIKDLFTKNDLIFTIMTS